MTNRQRSRDDVIRAAGKLFAERGFHGTSMRDLGEELGLLGSSLYSHIDGKNQLLIEVIASGATLFQDLADEVLASDASPEEQLHALMVGHVRIVVAHLDEARTFLNEARFLPDDDRSLVIAMRDRYEGAFRTVIERGQERGAFRTELDAGVASILVLSVLNALERWYRPEGRRSPEEVAGLMYAFVVEGIS